MQNPVSVKADNILKGAILVAMAVVMVAVMNAFAKQLGGIHHPIELTFYRNIIILAGMCAWFQLTGNWHLLRTKNLTDQFYRAMVGTMGVVLAFWAITKLPLADATTLFYTAPLIVTLLSFPMLGEKVGPFRGSAILIGFVGTIIVAGPTGHNLSFEGVVLAFGAALFHALTQLQLRKLGRNQNPLTTVFYVMFFGSLITGIAMPFVFTQAPSYQEFPYLALLAIAGISQQILKTHGYSLAPTAVVSPINYSGLLWAILIGFVVWGEVPGIHVYIGAIIIIAANLFILWREQYLKKVGRL